MNLHRYLNFALPALGLLLGGCAATQAYSFAGPEEAAVAVLTALDDGQVGDAERIYGSFADDAERGDGLYPVLYAAAQGRYEGGEPERAAVVLEFLVEQHPTAVASREALVYALFLERARAPEPSPEGSARLARAIDGLRAATPVLPTWVSLAETQLAIDEGRTDQARVAFERFLTNWTGDPEELMLYVEDLNRYLQDPEAARP